MTKVTQERDIGTSLYFLLTRFFHRSFHFGHNFLTHAFCGNLINFLQTIEQTLNSAGARGFELFGIRGTSDSEPISE
ncbi:MAG: hypothetical protein A3J67_01975 [Parcubacteria group bacterium RIFCSPHIGHO2_02_FULL_48_10b]|nr:MAG: hypothetical protein A3J67_01975 [Parcubacteria group bacterium RIFCSPHIGHO2_02_FULL_48_10b]